MGSKYVVRMIDERSREGSEPGFGGAVLWEEKKNITTPTLSLAWYLPNDFEAEWSGLRVRYRVELFTEGKRSRWAVASFSVESLKAGQALGKVDHVPLSTFLEQAIHLAGVQCITYPPGYEGAVLGINGRPLPGREGWLVSVSPDRTEGEPVAVSWLNETPKDILRDFLANTTDSSQRKRLDHSKRLKLVAKAWKAAPERSKAAEVKSALEAAGDPVGSDRVKQLIGEAREAGLIPPSTRRKK